MKRLTDSIAEVFYKLFSSYYRNRLSSDIGIQLRMRALDSTCEYIEKNLAEAPYYADKQQVIDFALNSVRIKGLYCEFGVYKGKSINYIARKVSVPVHAFDSFEVCLRIGQCSIKKDCLHLIKFRYSKERNCA